jgi:DNA-binding IclR family transcriptional regulator
MAGRTNQPGRTVVSKISMMMLAISEGSRTLTDIATRCELPLSTVHRLATDLAAWQLLERADDGSYQAGPPLRTIGGMLDDSGDPMATIRDRAVPIMEDLFRAVGVGVRVGVLDNALEVRYVQKDSLYQPVSQDCPAARLPSHASAIGKALLAFSPPHVINAVLAHDLRRYTPFTVTSPRLLHEAFRTIRATRLAICDRELRRDSRTVVAPVFGAGGLVVAAIELQANDLAKDVLAWRPALVVATGALSRELVRQHRFRTATICHHAEGKRVHLGATGT